jgi:uncharacterized repeat protein (TIGR01451 family)
MQISHRWLLVIAALCLIIPSSYAHSSEQTEALGAPLIDPTPLWQNKGCFASWCQTGWYASPSVADLTGDGLPEVIWSGYSIVVVNGATGNVLWTVRSGHDRSYTGNTDVGRTWPGIVVADVDGDGSIEIVTAHSGGWVGVYSRDGYWKPGWPRQVYTTEIRSLAAADLDNDRRMEIVVARASGGSHNQWTVLQGDGSTRPGWPRLSPAEPGYGWGAYNQNIGVGDIDGDGRAEIVGPSDVHYISAFNDDGSQIAANPRYGSKVWSQVGVHVSDAVDVRGYANCGTEHRPNFANSAPALLDLDRNGSLEIVVVGNVYNCGTDPYTDLAYVPFVFNADRTRWVSGSYDWTVIPPLGASSGAPLTQDYSVIQNALPNPVLADLDGDGDKELLYASYDGKLHAYKLQTKAPWGNWPINVTGRAGELSFASEPIVVDLQNDGRAEVIFGTWPRNGARRIGKLVVADWQGNVLQEIALPSPLSSDANAWNGVLGAPTIANLDADPDLELAVGTVGSGLVAYDLPGSANGRVLWGSGRGSLHRTGALPPNPLRATVSAAAGSSPQPGDIVAFQITLDNPSAAPIAPLDLQTTLPPQLSFVGGLNATRGSASESGGTIRWNGTVPAGTPVRITFQARINPGTPRSTITATARITGGQTQTLQAVLIVGGETVLLPLVRR